MTYTKVPQLYTDFLTIWFDSGSWNRNLLFTTKGRRDGKMGDTPEDELEAPDPTSLETGTRRIDLFVHTVHILRLFQFDLSLLFTTSFPLRERNSATERPQVRDSFLKKLCLELCLEGPARSQGRRRAGSRENAAIIWTRSTKSSRILARESMVRESLLTGSLF